MSILTTFTILFKSNAKTALSDVEALNKALAKLNKTSKAMNKLMDERHGKDLITIQTNNNLFKQEVAQQTNVKISNKLMKERNSRLGKTILNLRNLALGFLSLRTITRAFGERFDASTQMSQFSEALQVNALDVEAWGGAVGKVFKNSKVGMQVAMESFSKMTRQLRGIPSGQGSEIIQLAGVLRLNTFDSDKKIKSAYELLSEFPDAYEKLSNAQKRVAYGYLQSFFPMQMVDMITKHSKGLKDLLKEQTELAPDNNEHIDKIRQVNEQLFYITKKVDSLVSKFYDKIIFPLQHTALGEIDTLLSKYINDAKKNDGSFALDNIVGTALLGVGIGGVIYGRKKYKAKKKAKARAEKEEEIHHEEKTRADARKKYSQTTEETTAQDIEASATAEEGATAGEAVESSSLLRSALSKIGELLGSGQAKIAEAVGEAITPEIIEGVIAGIVTFPVWGLIATTLGGIGYGIYKLAESTPVSDVKNPDSDTPYYVGYRDFDQNNDEWINQYRRRHNEKAYKENNSGNIFGKPVDINKNTNSIPNANMNHINYINNNIASPKPTYMPLGNINIKIDSPIIDASGMNLNDARQVISEGIADHITNSVNKLSNGRAL